MAFPTDITLADSTPVNYTYSQISLEGSKSIRTDATRGIAYPRSLIISHQVNGKGNSISDRVLVRLQDCKEDTVAADGSSQTGSVYVVIEKPRKTVTVADIDSMVDQLKAFLTVANLTKLLNGEP